MTGDDPDAATPEAAAFDALRTPVGEELMQWVANHLGADPEPLAAATAARRALARLTSHPPVPAADLVHAALTQVTLRHRAAAKFGAAAARLYYTPAGLEQATRASVASYRARRFAGVLGADADRVADLGCGIGGDLLALAEAGIRVTGVDRDPLTVAVARANIAVRGLSERAEVRRGDVAEAADRPGGLIGHAAAVLCDPARRTDRGRTFDPLAFSPPLSVAMSLAGAAPGGCVKTAPGIGHDHVPDAAEAEWISVDGEVKEAALWFGALRAHGGPRSATVLSERTAATAHTLHADPVLPPPPVRAPGDYLYEPDGAVIRAGLVAEAAAQVDGALLDPRIAYITADRLHPTAYCRAYAVREVLPFSVKRLRAAVRRHRAGTVTIKKRGFAMPVDKLRAELRPRGENSIVIVLTRIGDKPFSMLCEEVKQG